MNFLLLEHCLTFVENQILQLGAISAISNIDNSTCLESFLILKSNHDIDLLRKQSECSHSPLRASSILCLQIAASDDLTIIEQSYEQLSIRLLEANLYDSVLEVASQYTGFNYIIPKSAIAACYKTRRWNLLLEYFKEVPDDQLDFDHHSMFIRSLLEIYKPYEAYCHLQKLISRTKVYSQQLTILSLLVRHRLGCLKLEDLKIFLNLITKCSSFENNAMVCLWSALEPFATEDELYGDTIQIAISYFWNTLNTNVLLVDAFGSLPSLKNRSKITRVAFATNNKSYLTMLASISHFLKLQDSNIDDVKIIYIGCNINTSHDPIDCINLSEKSVAATVRYLRELNIDILVDMIGSSSSRWIEVLSQNISSFQVAWFPADISFFSAPFYSALIVDRWTKPSSLINFSTKTLELTGISTLSIPLPDLVDKKNVLSVIPIDTFLILGRPDQLLPGSHQLIQNLLLRYSEIKILFVDNVWQEPGLLEFWWSLGCDQLLPNQVISSKNIDSISISDHLGSALVLSFNQDSPTLDASYFLRSGIPVVCLSSCTLQSSSLVSLLESLGLSSFIADDINSFYEIIDTILVATDIRLDIATKLPIQFENSLTMNYRLFASDLCQGFSLLSS